MEIHHGKHHAGYTAKLNAAIEGTDKENKSIKELMLTMDMSNGALEIMEEGTLIIVYFERNVTKWWRSSFWIIS